MVILHSDLNNFYATVERKLYPAVRHIEFPRRRVARRSVCTVILYIVIAVQRNVVVSDIAVQVQFHQDRLLRALPRAAGKIIILFVAEVHIQGDFAVISRLFFRRNIVIRHNVQIDAVLFEHRIRHDADAAVSNVFRPDGERIFLRVETIRQNAVDRLVDRLDGDLLVRKDAVAPFVGIFEMAGTALIVFDRAFLIRCRSHLRMIRHVVLYGHADRFERRRSRFVRIIHALLARTRPIFYIARLCLRLVQPDLDDLGRIRIDGTVVTAAPHHCQNAETQRRCQQNADHSFHANPS